MLRLDRRWGAILDGTPSCRIRPADYLDAMLGVSAALAVAWYYPMLSLNPGLLASLDPSGNAAAVPLGLLLTLVLHEGLHALALRLIGVRAMRLELLEYPLRLSFPRRLQLRVPIGVGINIGEPLTRNKALATLLPPLALSPILLLLAAHAEGVLRSLLVTASLSNTLGCSGDLTLFLLLLRTSRDAVIRDEGQALAIYGDCPPAPFTRALRSLGAAGAVLFLMLVVVYPYLVTAAFLSTAEQVSRVVRSAQANMTLLYDFHGLVTMRVDIWRTPSSYGCRNSYEPGPLFLAATLAGALAAGLARHRSLSKKAERTPG